MKYKLLLVLFIISLASALTLSFKPVSEICDLNQGCEVVHYSNYNFTFGIQNSHYGIFFFSLIIVLIFLQMKYPDEKKKKLIHLSILAGSVIAIYFLYIQQFVLHTYCKYCLLVDFSILVALIVIFPDLKKDFSKIIKKITK